MRTFLAVSPPSETAECLYRDRALLRTAWTGVRWVEPVNYHVTLVFLGERPESEVARIISTIDRIRTLPPGFEIRTAGPDCFGPIAAPRVIVERIGDGSAELKRLRTLLAGVCLKDYEREKSPYRPHLTLGRIGRRGASGPPGGLLPPGVKMDTVIMFPVREIILYRSDLSSGGPGYTRIRTWPLEEAP